MSKRVKVIFIISLSINLLLISYLAGKYIYYCYPRFFNKYGLREAPLKSIKLKWDTFLKSKPDTLDIIFMGTSITSDFPVQKFNNPHVKNVGLAYNQTLYLLRQVKKLIRRRPRKIFLEGGVNDFRNGVSVDTAYRHFLNIYQVIKEQSPKTKLYVQSVFPTNNYKFNIDIKAYNNKINLYCQQNHITYINLNPDFLKDGRLNPELTPDGIHLNQTGYFLWKRDIEKYVAE